jgi:hypothetical protein
MQRKRVEYEQEDDGHWVAKDAGNVRRCVRYAMSRIGGLGGDHGVGNIRDSGPVGQDRMKHNNA